jgi:ankyrin repeat protein
MHGHIDFVKDFLDRRGASIIDQKDNNGQTPLMSASWRGQKEVVILLLESGADVFAKDNAGWTALTVARMHKKDEVIALLECAMTKKMAEARLEKLKRFPSSVTLK